MTKKGNVTKTKIKTKAKVSTTPKLGVKPKPKILTKSSRNATASWSGYLHQGKVGIYVALKEIELIISKADFDANTSFNECYIIYENKEDFDIVINGNVKSRHQVKAYVNSKNKSKYEKAIKNFDMTNVSTFMECYLHVVCDINTAWNNITNKRGVELFQYGSNNYCSLACINDDLGDYAKNAIGVIRKGITHIDTKEGIFEDLLYKLDQIIKSEHGTKKKSQYEIKMSFSYIYNTIIDNNPIEKYDEGRLRRTIVLVYEGYKNDLNKYNMMYSQVEAAADSVIDKILNSTKEDFYNFLKNIHPDNPTISSRWNINEPGLREVFFYFLLNIANFNTIKLCYQDENKRNYILTTINEDSDFIAHHIIENGGVSKELFEGNYIINKHKNGPLIDSIMTIPEYKKHDQMNWDLIDQKLLDGNIFFSPKDINLMSIPEAKKIFNFIF